MFLKLTVILFICQIILYNYGIPDSLYRGDTSYDDPQDMVNGFSEYFYGVFKDSSAFSFNKRSSYFSSIGTVRYPKITFFPIYVKIKHKFTAGSDKGFLLKIVVMLFLSYCV